MLVSKLYHQAFDCDPDFDGHCDDIMQLRIKRTIDLIERRNKES